MGSELVTAFDGTPSVIPVIPDRAYTSQRINLDGRTYTLKLSWNQGQGSWYLSLYDSEETPLAQSVRLVSNWPLLRYYQSDPRVPPGELVAQDLTGDGSAPGFDELGIGKRVELTYFSATQ